MRHGTMGKQLKLSMHACAAVVLMCVWVAPPAPAHTLRMSTAAASNAMAREMRDTPSMVVTHDNGDGNGAGARSGGAAAVPGRRARETAGDRHAGTCADYTLGSYWSQRGRKKDLPEAGFAARGRPATLSVCELEQLHAECVGRINKYRAGALLFKDGSQDPLVAKRDGLDPLRETTGNNQCSSAQALGDLGFNLHNGGGCNGAHHTAGSCPVGAGKLGQNACCVRGAGSWGWQNSKIVTYADVKRYLFECLQDMWDEGVTTVRAL